MPTNTAAGTCWIDLGSPDVDASVSAVIRGPRGLPLSLWQAPTSAARCHGTFAFAELRGGLFSHD